MRRDPVAGRAVLALAEVPRVEDARHCAQYDGLARAITVRKDDLSRRRHNGALSHASQQHLGARLAKESPPWLLHGQPGPAQRPLRRSTTRHKRTSGRSDQAGAHARYQDSDCSPGRCCEVITGRLIRRGTQRRDTGTVCENYCAWLVQTRQDPTEARSQAAQEARRSQDAQQKREISDDHAAQASEQGRIRTRSAG